MNRVHFKKIEVRGDSMSPNYNDGDWLLFYLLPAKSKADSLVGKVVLIQRRSEVGTDFLQVKRVSKVTNDPDFANEIKIWVEGDNKVLSQDSRTWGAIAGEEILGRVLFRIRRSNESVH